MTTHSKGEKNYKMNKNLYTICLSTYYITANNLSEFKDMSCVGNENFVVGINNYTGITGYSNPLHRKHLLVLFIKDLVL